jgi:hypothetical protein
MRSHVPQTFNPTGKAKYMATLRTDDDAYEHHMTNVLRKEDARAAAKTMKPQGAVRRKKAGYFVRLIARPRHGRRRDRASGSRTTGSWRVAPTFRPLLPLPARSVVEGRFGLAGPFGVVKGRSGARKGRFGVVQGRLALSGPLRGPAGFLGFREGAEGRQVCGCLGP